MSKEDNIRDFLADLYQGIATKKPNASKNPQNFRAEVESIAGAAKLQEKTVTPSLASQRIVADDGNDGLSAVNIEAIQTVEGLANGSGVFYPATGKLYSKFTVDIPADDSGECSGEHIISVTELPTDNIRSDVMYKRVIDMPFQGIIMIDNDEDGPYDICSGLDDFGYTFEFYTVDTKPSDEDVIKTDYTNDSYCLYLVKDENDIYMYFMAEDYVPEGWMSVSELFSSDTDQISFGGVISDMKDAVSFDKYYALGGGTITAYYQYIDGAWSEYIVPNGTLTITKLGEHDVTLYSTVDVQYRGPDIYVGKTANDLPTDVAYGSYGIVTHGDSNLSGVAIPINVVTPGWNYLNYGNYVWYKDDAVYYSESTRQYILDKETFVWKNQKWNGLESFYGSNVWTDGINAYYSVGVSQYVLNGDTWEPKTWNGYTPENGYYVWTDGANVYYSSGSAQYVLDKETSTWGPKTWNGMTSFDGRYVWTDGSNIYYSYSTYYSTNEHYVLNKETSTWEPKTWTGNQEVRGSNIWTDGVNIYHSYGGKQHILSGDTWKTKTWDNNILYNFYGEYVWTDGTNYYCSLHYNSTYYGQVLLAPSASVYVFANDKWYKASDMGKASLAEKTIKNNGTYRAIDDNVQGYTNVTVNMPSVYTVTSLDDIAKNAPNGSIAMVLEVIK